MPRIVLATLIAITSLASGRLLADETTFGIGAAINDNIKLYFPINTDRFLIEPTIVYTNSKREFLSGPLAQEFDIEQLELGVGLFMTNTASEKTKLYYGARLGYIDSNFVNTKTNGYFFAPTFGAEYYLADSFSIGLDLALNYSKVDGSDADQTNFSTQSEIIIRYRF